MKVKLKTDILKDAVSRAIKGAGNNKLIPITSLIGIDVTDNKLTLITTDATNYLYIIEDKVVADDFYAVVDANTFAKLISKMTSDTITLEVKTNVLSVKGNGNYKIELPLDENGEPITYPDPYVNLDLSGDTSAGVVNKTTFNVVLETIKPALAVTYENPCYTGYYAGDQIVATDACKIASMNIKLFGEPKLLNPEMVDLISVMQSEKISMDIVDNTLILSSPDCIIVGKFMEDIDEFNIEPIMELVATEFDSSCSVHKNTLLQLLDRLSLFVGAYDDNAIDLTFTQKGLQASSKAASGIELIEYVSSNNFKEFTCSISIDMFVQEIKAIKSDVIEIHYGEDNAIKMVDGNITILVALMVDDDYEEE